MHLPRISALPLLTLLASLSVSAEERFALVIGANAGWANDRPLRYAEADAERMKEVLVELGGFAPERVRLLKDPDTGALRAELEKLVEELKASRSREQLVVFYYSGHADERNLHLRGPPLSHSELYQALRDLPATVRLGMMDACRSGSILSAKGGTAARPFELTVMNELGARGLALLTSSGADELSQEVRAVAGSVFTHHLISGLRGAGDFSGDGAVTLTEVYQYALKQTEVDTAPTSAPHRPAFHFDLAGQIEPVITRPQGGAAWLLLPRAEGERYVVVDEHETRLVAEGRTRAETQVSLALAPGSYQVTHVQREQLAVASIHVEHGARIEAAGLTYVGRPLSTGFLKGQPEQLEGEELSEWRKGEALRVLDQGDAQAALDLIEQNLKEQPDDLGSLRTKARALVRLADAHRARGELNLEHESLRLAMEADPTLSEDSDFASRYQRLREAGAKQARKLGVQDAARVELDRNPHLQRRWGLGFSLVSPKGVIVPWAAFVFAEGWDVELALDFFMGGIDLSLRYAPNNSMFTGSGISFGMGTHVSVARRGGPSAISFEERGRGLSAQDLWGDTAHIETGWISEAAAGLFFELGVGMVFFVHEPTGAPNVAPMLSFSSGWFF
jgi:hypothetical protein